MIQLNFLSSSSLDFISSISPSSPSYPLPLFLLRKSENLFSVIRLHKEEMFTPGMMYRFLHVLSMLKMWE